MIALSGTSPARESCDQTKTWTIFGVHSQDENGLVSSSIRKFVRRLIQAWLRIGTLEHDRAERNVHGA